MCFSRSLINYLFLVDPKDLRAFITRGSVTMTVIRCRVVKGTCVSTRLSFRNRLDFSVTLDSRTRDVPPTISADNADVVRRRYVNKDLYVDTPKKVHVVHFQVHSENFVLFTGDT